MEIMLYLVVGAKIGWLIEPVFTGQKGELGTWISVLVSSMASFGTAVLLLLMSGKLSSGVWMDTSSLYGAPIAAVVLNLTVRRFKS